MKYSELEYIGRSALEISKNIPTTSGRASTVAKRKEFPYYGYLGIGIASCPEFVMFSNNDDYSVIDQMWSGCYEPLSLSLWSIQVEKKPPIILDIGAYTGIYGLLAAAISKGSHVIFVEPVDRIFSRILINKAVNGFVNATILKCAASDGEYEAEISVIAGDDILPTSSSIIIDGGNEVDLEDGRRRVERQKVNLVKVDTILEARPKRVGIAKISAPQQESKVVSGMSASIRRWLPDIIIEIGTESSFEEITSFLKDANKSYNIYQIDDDRNSIRSMKGIPFNTAGGRNFFASRRREDELIGEFSAAISRSEQYIFSR